MKAGITWKHDLETGKTTVFRSPSGMSNGIAFDAQGRMIVAHQGDYGLRYVSRTDMAPAKPRSSHRTTAATRSTHQTT